MYRKRTAAATGAIQLVLIVVSIVLLPASSVRARQLEVLLEEPFSDSDLSDWTFEEEPGSSGEWFWSATEGQPPGALELRSQNGPPVRAYSTCIPVLGGPPWTASASARATGAKSRCTIDFVEHFEADCADPQNGNRMGQLAEVDDGWITLDTELITFPHLVGVTFELVAGGNGSCFFDNVVIRGTRGPSIPVVAPGGLLGLAALLALVAVAVLRWSRH